MGLVKVVDVTWWREGPSAPLAGSGLCWLFGAVSLVNKLGRDGPDTRSALLPGAPYPCILHSPQLSWFPTPTLSCSLQANVWKRKRWA